MAGRGQGLGQAIKNRLYQLVFYNWEDLKRLQKQLIVIVVCTGILVYIWNIGWPRSLTWHIAYILAELVPGPPGPVFVAPLGFLLGLISLFWFDAYKRLQGLLLLVPGVLVLFSLMLFFDRFSNVPITPLVMITAVITFIFGMLWGGILEGIAFADNPQLERGFQRLVAVVGIIGGWGIVEASLSYQSPIILIAGSDPPWRFTAFRFEGFTDAATVSPIPLPGYAIAVIGLIALGLLLSTLWVFTEYEMEKNVLILGPDRAGKTWLMSGAGFSLQQRAVTDYRFEDPEINPQLQPYVEVFRDRNFDDALLDPNSLADFDFFSFKFETGILPKRRLRVRTLDYAGEHLSSIDIKQPWDDFNSKWGNNDRKKGVEPNDVPSFETLVALNEHNRITQGDIPSLLSVMIDEYDAIGLVLPGDEFATNMIEEDLPAHIERNQLDTRLADRKTDAHNGSGTGYFQIYKKLMKEYTDTDFFFVTTMSDTFLESFKQDQTIPHMDPKGNPNWEAFRQHIYDKIEEENQRRQIDFMSESDANDYRQYYPIYFEPLAPPEHQTDSGNFKPHLDWDDDYYPLRGLKYLLKRMGR